MIGFFRRIRKKLADDNQLLKYTRYAIGEILLVMVGILLALQVNSWNEERKADNEAKIIRAALQKELVKDTLLLHKNIEIFKPLISEHNKLNKRINQKGATLDTLILVAKEFNPSYELIRSYNNITFQSIISTGKIDFLEDSEKQALLDLNKIQSEVLDYTTEDNYIHFSSFYLEKYSNGIRSTTDSYVNNLAWDIENEREFSLLLNNICSYRRYFLSVYSESYKDILKKTKEVLIAIE